MIPKSKRRLLQAYSRITNENLRALISELVQIYTENADGRTPKAKYQAKIEAYADRFGDDLDLTFVDPQDDLEVAFPADNELSQTEGLITLQSLTLCNFGSYRGEATLELGPLSKRNVTAVIGSNGDGKSTLFYALNWALYGEDYLDELEIDKGRTLKRLVNRGALAEARDTGSIVTTSVRLTFRIRGADYYVVREVTASPTDKNTARLDHSPTRLRKIDASGNHTELLPGALSLLLSSLPKHVRDFYFFDGEQINRFVAPGSRVHIRRAIRRVMGIDALEQTAEGLNRVATDLRREVRSNSTGELEIVAGKLEIAHTKLEEARRTAEAKKEELGILSAAIKELENLLSSTPDTRPHQLRRANLEKELGNYNEDQERLAYEIRELAGDTSLILGGDAVSLLVQDLDKKRQAGVIPGPINRQLLKDLLELGECICGSDISEGTHTRAHLESTLTALQKRTDTGEASLALFFELSALDGRLEERASSLDKKRMELQRLYERRRIAREALSDVEATLTGMVEVDRSGWERERSAKREQERRAAEAKGAAESDLQNWSQQIKVLQEEERRIQGASQKALALATRRNWAEAAEAALRSVHDEFAAAARKDVESSTSQLWRQLLTNVDRYKVVVTEDFELQVLDETGNPTMQDLAMGQQQCLGLSFITAVAQVAESRPPLVIDMPFGRLGADVASSVASSLPMLTEQLILFVLPDTEWNEQTRGAIEPFLAREYVIKYDSARESTSIRKMGEK